jgi:hypothetical protein
MWIPIATAHPSFVEVPPGHSILLANASGVLGVFAGCTNDPECGETWFIDDCLYDGDTVPTHWLLLPPVPA